MLGNVDNTERRPSLLSKADLARYVVRLQQAHICQNIVTIQTGASSLVRYPLIRIRHLFEFQKENYAIRTLELAGESFPKLHTDY